MFHAFNRLSHKKKISLSAAASNEIFETTLCPGNQNTGGVSANTSSTGSADIVLKNTGASAG